MLPCQREEILAGGTHSLFCPDYPLQGEVQNLSNTKEEEDIRKTSGGRGEGGEGNKRDRKPSTKEDKGETILLYVFSARVH